MGEHPLAGIDAGQDMGLQPLDLLGGQPEDVGRLGQLVDRLGGQRLARLPGQLLGERRGIRFEAVGGGPQQIGPLEEAQPLQLQRGRIGGGHGVVHVGE